MIDYYHMSEGLIELELKYLKEAPGVQDIIANMVGEGEYWDESLAQAVIYLHDGTHRQTINLNRSIRDQEEPLADIGMPLKVLFVTVTSAIPYAVAIRECWKVAYPEEKPPKFFFIDVGHERFGIDGTPPEELVRAIDIRQIEKLRQIGQKYNVFDNTAVFDEFRNFGRTIREIQSQLQEAGFTNVNFMIGAWGHPLKDVFIPEEDRPLGRKGLLFEGTSYRPTVFQITKNSINLFKDMKTIGQQMGQQILKHASLTGVST